MVEGLALGPAATAARGESLTAPREGSGVCWRGVAGLWVQEFRGEPLGCFGVARTSSSARQAEYQLHEGSEEFGNFASDHTTARETLSQPGLTVTASGI